MTELRRDGLGLGLRTAHYGALWSREDAGVDFFEAVTENYLGGAPLPRRHLARARELAPVVLHGVGLNLLGPAPLDRDYLRRLRSLARELDAPVVSDHLCWTGMPGQGFHDLLPVPCTRAVADFAVARLSEVQDALGRPFAVEPLAAMLGLVEDDDRWAFLIDVVERAGCGLILDVNNVWVMAQNLGLDPMALVAMVEPSRVAYVHVAGHQRPARGPIVDTHDQPVCAEVWDLYGAVWARLGPFPTLLERDADVPKYETLLEELALARRRQQGQQTGAPFAPPGPLAVVNAPPPAPLRSWQTGLAALLSRPLTWSPPSARADVSRYPASVVSRVSGPDPVAGLRAYHEQVWFRLITVLQAESPTLAAVMGLWAFNQLASAHLCARRPSSWDIADAATGLSATLVGSVWDSPMLREAAAYDEAYAAVVRAPREQTWAPTEAPDPGVRLRRAACARRMVLRWPWPDVRGAAAAWTSPHPMPPPPVNPMAWLVMRTRDDGRLERALPASLDRLVCALDRLPLGGSLVAWEADEDASDPAVASRLQAWMREAVTLGWWVVDVHGGPAE